MKSLSKINNEDDLINAKYLNNNIAKMIGGATLY